MDHKKNHGLLQGRGFKSHLGVEFFPILRFAIFTYAYDYRA